MNRYSAEGLQSMSSYLGKLRSSFLRMSCFILEIQLPHLFGVVINLSDFFLLHLNFLQGLGCFIFPLHSASWSCALGSGER